MKLRSWLIVLLVLVLPVKGALAAAGLLCHGPASAWTQGAATHHAHSGASHDHAPAAEAAPAHAEHHVHHAAGALPAVASIVGDDGASGQSAESSCLACAAICGASPLPPAIVDRVPVVEPARDWRVWAAPEPPSLTLAALERPPRTP